MKRIIYLFSGALLLMAFIGVFGYINQDKLIDRYIERQLEAVDWRADLLEADGKIRLVTVGTGSALPGDRTQTCHAVFVDGRFFLFDIGAGATKKMESLRLPLYALEAIFVSRWHQDHMADLAYVTERSWLHGRYRRMNVYSPEQSDVSCGAVYHGLDAELRYRGGLHREQYLDTSHVLPMCVQIPTDTAMLITLWQDDDTYIRSFEIDHGPDTKAVGYYIQHEDKALIISGGKPLYVSWEDDLADADILVLEALSKDLISRAISIQRSADLYRNATILEDFMQYRLSTEEAAEIASKSRAQKLILTHLGPAPENPISRRFYTAGLGDIYGETILLAEDGDLYTVE